MLEADVEESRQFMKLLEEQQMVHSDPIYENCKNICVATRY